MDTWYRLVSGTAAALSALFAPIAPLVACTMLFIGIDFLSGVAADRAAARTARRAWHFESRKAWRTVVKLALALTAIAMAWLIDSCVLGFLHSNLARIFTGFTCGVVEKSRLIDGTKVRVGDVLVGIASSGVHSNGFSLVRKVVADAGLDLRKAYPELDGRVLGEVLLTPTKIYVKQVLEVIRACNVHGISHITGGGFDENIPRILSEGQGIEIHEGTWEILPVFRLLEKYGKIAHREMFNIFNMGIGMVIAVSQDEASEVIAILEKQGEKASVIGRATDRPGVEIR